MSWQSMETAPRDGNQILIAWDNGCFYEYAVVRWAGGHLDYPWEADGNAYPEGRPDVWRFIDPPTCGADHNI